MWAHPQEHSMHPQHCKKTTCVKYTLFASQIRKKVWKIAPKRYPNGWDYLGGGAPSGTFGTPVCFFTRKVHPKCSKSDPRCQIDSKSCAKVIKVTPNDRNLNLNNCIWKLHYSLAECSVTMAWWTARSALNWIVWFLSAGNDKTALQETENCSAANKTCITFAFLALQFSLQQPH
jgi:hypothetical protein